jgi:hypothetical protein
MIGKIHVLGLALVAMFALSAVATSAASAELVFELALWLFNGNDVVTPILVVATGELLLHNLLNGAIIHCSGQFEGWIENNSLDLITMVWDLELLVLIVELSTGPSITCESLAVCEANTALIWPAGLEPNGWVTEVEEDPAGVFWELIFGVGYHIECKVVGIPFVEECTLAEGTGFEALNVTGGVELMGSAEPETSCNGNAFEGELESNPGNLILSVESGTISISLNALQE